MGVVLGSRWVMLRSCWGHFGIILGSCWDHVAVSLGSVWDQFGISLGLYWGKSGVILAPFWHQRSSPKCRGADLGSRIKISGHLLGQNTQNFELYPFRLVLGNQKGLAAEGEALRINLSAWMEVSDGAYTGANECEFQLVITRAPVHGRSEMLFGSKSPEPPRAHWPVCLGDR